MSLNPIGKILIITGTVLILFGLAFLLFDRLGFLGRIPGDIVIRKKNFTVYVPLVTSIILNILLTTIFFIINLIRK
jgi:hypothetical protein